ncbi:hypothetical protein EDC01DRAFT_627072 [Geopyxis carbonaria]|nr:hypothetical protein EDC01DRAFT_627072 [Geopyxis carbonaria]
MDRLSDRKNQGRPRGDSWHGAAGKHTNVGAIPLAARITNETAASSGAAGAAAAAARYRTHHDAGTATPATAARSQNSWGDEIKNRSSSSGKRQPYPYPNPHSNSNPHTPHHPAHQQRRDHVDVGHRVGTFAQGQGGGGAALAARITFPLAPSPANGRTKPLTRQRRHSDPTPDTQATPRSSAPPRPLSPQRPLLGPPRTPHSPRTLIAQYQPSTTYCTTAESHLAGPDADVFDWWYHRILDRLDRKLSSAVALDPHERAIDALSEHMRAGAASGAAIVNYFAEQMVPRGGFSAEQVARARRDPARWDRRNLREQRWDEMDPGGAEGVGEAWREEQRRKARARWRRWEEGQKPVEEGGAEEGAKMGSNTNTPTAPPATPPHTQPHSPPSANPNTNPNAKHNPSSNTTPTATTPLAPRQRRKPGSRRNKANTSPRSRRGEAGTSTEGARDGAGGAELREAGFVWLERVTGWLLGAVFDSFGTERWGAGAWRGGWGLHGLHGLRGVSWAFYVTFDVMCWVVLLAWLFGRLGGWDLIPLLVTQ